MKYHIFETYQLMCREAEQQIRCAISQKKDALVCLAAGHTSLGVFDRMVQAQYEGFDGYQSCQYIGLDEWGGLGQGDDGSMVDFMRRNCFQKLGIEDGRIHFFNGKANLEEECDGMNTILAEAGPIDVMLLGMGMNGHLGLIEPGDDYHLHAHVVKLSDTTKDVMVKYFNTPRLVTKGVTLGMRDILESKHVILTVADKRKAEICKRLMEGDDVYELPARMIKQLPHASILLDAEAASLL